MSQFLNILVAYPYMSIGMIKALKQVNEELGQNFRFLLDSGAFTAYTSGKDIKLDDYCSFIDGLPLKPWHYFALDVIGNPIATKKNYEIMLERGYTPTPVFTFGDDLSEIDEYYKTSDFIGIGGLVGRKSNEMLWGLGKIMEKVNGRKVHLLGFTRIEYLKLLRPYSCDSSSWNSMQRYGGCQLYESGGKFQTVTRKDFVKEPTARIKKNIIKNGGEYRVLGQKKEWVSSGQAQQVSTSSWIRCTQDVEMNIGTKLFLATVTDLQVKLIYEGYKNATKR